MILEREILPTTVPEIPMVRRMTLGMNNPLVFHPCTQEPRWRSSRRSSLMVGIPCLSDSQQQFISTRLRLR